MLAEINFPMNQAYAQCCSRWKTSDQLELSLKTYSLIVFSLSYPSLHQCFYQELNCKRKALSRKKTKESVTKPGKKQHEKRNKEYKSSKQEAAATLGLKLS